MVLQCPRRFLLARILYHSSTSGTVQVSHCPCRTPSSPHCQPHPVLFVIYFNYKLYLTEMFLYALQFEPCICVCHLSGQWPGQCQWNNKCPLPLSRLPILSILSMLKLFFGMMFLYVFPGVHEIFSASTLPCAVRMIVIKGGAREKRGLFKKPSLWSFSRKFQIEINTFLLHVVAGHSGVSFWGFAPRFP